MATERALGPFRDSFTLQGVMEGGWKRLSSVLHQTQARYGGRPQSTADGGDLAITLCILHTLYLSTWRMLGVPLGFYFAQPQKIYGGLNNYNRALCQDLYYTYGSLGLGFTLDNSSGFSLILCGMPSCRPRACSGRRP